MPINKFIWQLGRYILSGNRRISLAIIMKQSLLNYISNAAFPKVLNTKLSNEGSYQLSMHH